MRTTFAEIAAYVRKVEPTQRLGAINYCAMIAELAEALVVLEYNTAAQLAAKGVHPDVQTETMQLLIQNFLVLLRSPLPDQPPPTPPRYTPGQDLPPLTDPPCFGAPPQ